MRMDKLTSKFQLALSDAQSLAVGRDHQFIEPAHVMVALLDQDGGTVRPLLAQADANVTRKPTPTSTCCDHNWARRWTACRVSRGPAATYRFPTPCRSC